MTFFELSIYHLSVLAMMAMFSVGVCSSVAQCDESERFCLRIASQEHIGATVP